MDWAGFTTESFEYVSADQKQHVSGFPSSWSPGDFYTRWKINPLFASMWLCLFARASVTEAARTRASASPAVFVAALREAKSEQRWPPSPAQVLTTLETSPSLA